MRKVSKMEIRVRCGDRSLLQIALDVHGTSIGTFDRSEGDQATDVVLLMDAVETWEPARYPFDDAVLALIRSAIEEWKKVIERLIGVGGQESVLSPSAQEQP